MENPLVEDLRKVLNQHSVENASNTPDFILAEFLTGCLELWAKATKARDVWYKGVTQVPGASDAEVRKAVDVFRMPYADSLSTPIPHVVVASAQGRQGD